MRSGIGRAFSGNFAMLVPKASLFSPSFLSKPGSGFCSALGIAIVVWIGICIGAYFVTGVNGFYAVAFCVGMVMGGIQSLSRSTYSKMLPAESHNHASYFSFYDVCDKLGYFFGILSFGVIEELTGSMRNSIIVLVLFFCLGLFLLIRIGKTKALKSL